MDKKRTHITGYIWVKDSSRPIFVEDFVDSDKAEAYIKNMEQVVSDPAKRAETHSIRIGSLVVLTGCVIAIKLEASGQYTCNDPVKVSI